MNYPAYRRGVGALRRAAEWLSTLMFAGIFLLFIVAIVQRYLLERPVSWIDESMMMLFLWSTLITEALVLGEREQVRFELVNDLFGPSGRRWIGITGSVLIAAAYAVAAPTILGYILFLWREKTDALQWRLDWVFSVFFLYWVATIVRALDRVIVLCSPGWEAEVADVPPDGKTNVLG
jgi:TRAP-type transport system small permease protein